VVFPLIDQSPACAFSEVVCVPRRDAEREGSTTRHFGPINGAGADTGKIPSQFDSIKQEMGSVYFQSACIHIYIYIRD